MSTTSNASGRKIDESDSFLRDVLAGLNQSRKTLNCKYFYDEQGSRLFDRICELEEYYLTRTELSIMQGHAGEMAEALGPGLSLIELGSGSSVKTRLLLDRLVSPVAYLPLDISEEHLMKTAARLRSRYPGIEILPIVADFSREIFVPSAFRRPGRLAVYFPGSTIGNFPPEEAGGLLGRIGDLLGPGESLLIGIDLQKDPAVIEAAYNDAEGVTAEFNLNLLHRINRELNADFDVESFRHRAAYDAREGRVELSVVSQRAATIRVQGREFQIDEGEEILTEYSHKYTIEGFARIAARAGFALRDRWTDGREYFAILHLIRERDSERTEREEAHA
ncbi:MAG: L-histidine N(alpha)-methyltransferase [Blastocatellia bacterium]|nr:L-histidine N(alpha)-methyltransferase [Blastocatellia bacterium]